MRHVIPLAVVALAGLATAMYGGGGGGLLLGGIGGGQSYGGGNGELRHQLANN